MKKIFAALFVLTMIASSAALATPGSGGASSVKLTIYGAWLSPNSDCTSPVEIYNDAAGKTIDLADINNNTIGEKAIANGTYKCLILKMNDIVEFTPDTNDGLCVVGTSTKIDTCTSFGGNSTDHSTDLTGTTINCGATIDTATGDQLFLYVSDESACEESNKPGCLTPNAFLPPTGADDAAHGVKLQNDIVISANTTGSFIFNIDSKVGDDGAQCNMEPPKMGYK